MEITLTLTPEQVKSLEGLKKTRVGKSDQDLLMQVVSRGLYDITYRSARNKQQWAEFREYNKMKKSEQEG